MLEDSCIKLLCSMSYDDIKFGIALAKSNGIVNKVYTELLRSALSVDEWSRNNTPHHILESNWCVSVNENKIYRCLKWDGSFNAEVVYLENV